MNLYSHVPAALLTYIDTCIECKNLKFEVDNGGIDVEIFLIGRPDPDLQLGAGSGDTTVIHTTLDLEIHQSPQ